MGTWLEKEKWDRLIIECQHLNKYAHLKGQLCKEE